MGDEKKEECFDAPSEGPSPPTKKPEDDTTKATLASDTVSSEGGARQAKTKAKDGPTKAGEIEKAPARAQVPAPASTRNWPLRNIKETHDHDVLYGRGGGTNHHVGNKRYRKMVDDRKMDYVTSKRLDKPMVALEIIRLWRSQDPPGRFLKLDEETGLWIDVGDKKAREKTSQALREKAPEIRKQHVHNQEVHKLKQEGKAGSDEEIEEVRDSCVKKEFLERNRGAPFLFIVLTLLSSFVLVSFVLPIVTSLATGKVKEKPKPRPRVVKKTAFKVMEKAKGVSDIDSHGGGGARAKKGVNRLILARDHSLGRNYLNPDEHLALDGFSWDEPVVGVPARRSATNRASYPQSKAEQGWGSGKFADPAAVLKLSALSPRGGSLRPGAKVMPPSLSSRSHSLNMNPLPGGSINAPASQEIFAVEQKSASSGALEEWSSGVDGGGTSGSLRRAGSAGGSPDGDERGDPVSPCEFTSQPPPPQQQQPPKYLGGGQGVSAFARKKATSSKSRDWSGDDYLEGDGGTRSPSGTSEDGPVRPPPHLPPSRGDSGGATRSPYSGALPPLPHGSTATRDRQWSTQSDDFRKVASMMGDDIYVSQSWSESDEQYPTAPPEGHSQTPHRYSQGGWKETYGGGDEREVSEQYSSHERWHVERQRKTEGPYTAAIREASGPMYGPPPEYRPPYNHDGDGGSDGAAHHPPSGPHVNSYHCEKQEGSSDETEVERGIMAAVRLPTFASSRPSFAGPPPSSVVGRGGGSVAGGAQVTKPSLRRKLSGGGITPRIAPPPPSSLQTFSNFTRPQPIKRNTSHHCENDETKSRVKRSLLSREHILADGNMQASVAEFDGVVAASFDEEGAMNNLESSMRGNSLKCRIGVANGHRKPSALKKGRRITTAAAIQRAFAEDISPDMIGTMSGPLPLQEREEGCPADESAVIVQPAQRPRAITAKSRISTAEAIEMAFLDIRPTASSRDQHAPFLDYASLGRTSPLMDSAKMNNTPEFNVDSRLKDTEKRGANESYTTDSADPILRGTTMDDIAKGLGENPLEKTWLEKGTQK